MSQPYLGINEPALAGDHLAWQAGPYTIVMDLSSGKTKLVGAAARRPVAHAAGRVADAPCCGWSTPATPRQQTLVYAYDFSSRRRQRLLETERRLDMPALAGATAYWLRGQRRGATAVVACDIASGRRRVLATGNGLGPFLLADGSLVVWSHQDRPRRPSR